jgi:hypothetical protein
MEKAKLNVERKGKVLREPVTVNIPGDLVRDMDGVAKRLKVPRSRVASALMGAGLLVLMGGKVEEIGFGGGVTVKVGRA